MDCREARAALHGLASGEPGAAEERAELAAHLRECAGCRREGFLLDPAATVSAFGAPRAPDGFAAAVLAAVADLPARGLAPASDRPTGQGSGWALAAACAVVALWASLRLLGPVAVSLLVAWLGVMVTGLDVVAATLRGVLAVATPGLALAVAAGVVLAEVAVLGRWVRPTSR